MSSSRRCQDSKSHGHEISALLSLLGGGGCGTTAGYFPRQSVKRNDNKSSTMLKLPAGKILWCTKPFLALGSGACIDSFIMCHV